MHDTREGIHRLGVHEHVQLHHVALHVFIRLVIHRAKAARDAFDAVMEIDQDLVQRNQACQHHAARVECFRVIQIAAFLGDQRHHVTDVFVRADDECLHHRLFDLGDVRHVRHERRIIHFLHRAVGQINLVHHARIRRDDVHVVFTTQTFLHDLQVEQTQKSAAETKPERHRCFRRIHKRRVIELQLRHRRFQRFVIRRVDRINAAEHHRMDLFEPGQLGGRIPRVGDSVAHLHICRTLDVGGHVAGFASFQLLALIRLGIKTADFLHFKILAGV